MPAPIPHRRLGDSPLSVSRIALGSWRTFERMDRHMRAIAARRNLSEVENRPRDAWRVLDHAVVLYQLFPNTVLIYDRDLCTVFVTFPLSTEESVLHLAVLADPQARARKPDEFWNHHFAIVQKALGEDFAIAEGVQRNFHSGANERQTFGKFIGGTMGTPINQNGG